MNHIKVNIFGESYIVRGDVDENYIYEVGKFVIKK